MSHGLHSGRKTETLPPGRESINLVSPADPISGIDQLLDDLSPPAPAGPPAAAHRTAIEAAAATPAAPHHTAPAHAAANPATRTAAATPERITAAPAPLRFICAIGRNVRFRKIRKILELIEESVGLGVTGQHYPGCSRDRCCSKNRTEKCSSVHSRSPWTKAPQRQKATPAHDVCIADGTPHLRQIKYFA